MVTQIQLGNFFSANGRTVLGGVGGSGIDTQSLIESLTTARRIPATILEGKIELNTKRSSALLDFSSLLSQFQDATNLLRNPPGVGNESQNIFKYFSGAVTSNTSVTGSSYVTATVAPGASQNTYSITDVTSIARAKKQKTDSFFVATTDTSVVTAAATPGFFKAGTINVNGADITLEAGDGLSTVVAKFNQQKSTTGIEANILKAGTGEYVITFTATATGESADFDLNDGGTVTDATGVLSLIGRTNLLSNGTFTDDITGWDDASVGTGSIAYDDGALELSGAGAGNEAFARQAMTTEIGQEYTVRATLADLTASAFIRIGSGSDVGDPSNYDIEDYEVMADGTVEFTFTATSTTTYLTVNSDTNATPIRLDDVSVVSNATPTVTTTQEAANTVFKIDGVDIERESTSVSDVIDNVTFNFLQTTPALTELTVDVKPDTGIIKNGILNLVNAYNDLKLFAAKQAEVGADGVFTEDSLLHDNPTFRNVMNSITAEITGIVNGITGGNPSRLSEVGLTFVDLPATPDHPLVRNVLNVDEAALDSILATNFEGVRKVFEFDLTSNNPNLAVFSRTNALAATNFTLDIDPSGGGTFNAYIDGVGDPIALEATALSGGAGYTLKGVAGTEFEGLVLIYSSTSASTITVTATQGLADRLYNASELALKDGTGTLALEFSTLQSTQDRLTEEIARIDLQVEKFREQLLAKFTALEQAISLVNTLLQSLDAQDQARIAASS